MVLFHHDKAKTPGRKTPAQGRGSNTATNGVFQRVSTRSIVGNKPTALKAKKAQKKVARPGPQSAICRVIPLGRLFSPPRFCQLGRGLGRKIFGLSLVGVRAEFQKWLKNTNFRKRENVACGRFSCTIRRPEQRATIRTASSMPCTLPTTRSITSRRRKTASGTR